MTNEYHLLIIILDALDRLSDLLNSLDDAGVPGVTIMNSVGGRKAQSWLHNFGRQAWAVGADFGGNSTLAGASANLAVASFAARSGYPLSFMRFASYGILTSFITLLLGSVYLWLFYLL